MRATCSTEGCQELVVGRGLCNKHYRRAIAAGTRPEYPTKAEAIPLADRFWAKVKKTSTCWLWEGRLLKDGYGQIWTGQREERVHRLSYEWAVGPIPEGLVLDHICRVRNCVNPEHMEPVTNRTNVLRGIGPSALAARRTHCVNGHEFTASNTRISLKGSRVCRTCRLAVGRRYEERKKAASA